MHIILSIAECSMYNKDSKTFTKVQSIALGNRYEYFLSSGDSSCEGNLASGISFHSSIVDPNDASRPMMLITGYGRIWMVPMIVDTGGNYTQGNQNSTLLCGLDSEYMVSGLASNTVSPLQTLIFICARMREILLLVLTFDNIPGLVTTNHPDLNLNGGSSEIPFAWRISIWCLGVQHSWMDNMLCLDNMSWRVSQ